MANGAVPAIEAIKFVWTDIKSLTREELEAQFKSWAEPAWRVDQLLNWLYVRRARSWDTMVNLPRALREKLGAAHVKPV